MEIRLSPKKLTYALLLLTAVMLLLHSISYIGVFMGWREIPWIPINFDCEANVPTLYSTYLLGFCAFLAFLCGLGEKQAGGKYILWWLMAFVFMAVSLDEAIKIHEPISSMVRRRFDFGGYLRFAWVLPYSIIVVVLFFLYLPFIYRLPPHVRKFFILAGILYVGGGLGIEIPEGAHYDVYGQTRIYHLMITFEELFEMLGCVGFIYAFSTYLDKHLSGFRLHITSAKD